MAADKDTVVVFGPAYPMNQTPMWIAHDKGFFEEESINLELRPTLGIPDSEHPRFQWRKEGKVVFQSPGGSGTYRSVREDRDPTDVEINVISIANRTAHVFVAKPEIQDPSGLRGKRLGADIKGGSSMDAKVVLRHFGIENPEKDVIWVNSRGKPPDTERYRLELFDKGELDAVCCDPPHWNLAVKMGGRQLTSCRDLFSLPEGGLATSPVVIREKPELVKGMIRSVLRGAKIARSDKSQALESILRHNPHTDEEMAGLAWEEVHEEWGPVLDIEAYQRKVDIYTREWNLPTKPISTYYHLKLLKEVLGELGMLGSWDPAMDAAIQ